MEAKLEKIDSSFIGRQIVSPTMLNFMKGTIWGSAWAGSQTICEFTCFSRALRSRACL